MADDKNKNKLVDDDYGHRQYVPRPLCEQTTFSCNKLLLFLYQLLYLFVGLGLFILGVFTELERQNHRHLNNSLSLPVALVMFVGLFVAINAFGGIYGTLKENSLLLKLFLSFTVIAFVVQVAIGVLAYIYKRRVVSMVRPDLMFGVEAYSDSTEITAAMDTLQSTFGCCGITSFQDYETNPNFACTAGSSVPEACGVPSSCCTPQGLSDFGEEMCGQGVRLNTTSPTGRVYIDGCVNSFTFLLSSRLDLVGAFALGCAIPQVIGFLLTYYFIRRVENNRCWYTATNSDLYQAL
ncbi:tetraspanin-33-like [Pecten maximus]|uniref:tetraspanin-33-like n=1 Tax=Pecten maximus TaxID=6579 RepID=UPI0014582E60|nr:tetraspanin-33-like [Pecten maximus]